MFFNQNTIFLSLLCYFTCSNAEVIDPCYKHFEIVSDLSEEDCGTGFVLQKEGHPIHQCFPHCVKFDLQLPCSDTNPCPPGYLCPGGGQPCAPDKSSCIYHYNNPSNPWVDAWKPTCLPDGSWAPKQCKGEPTSGRCFCYDTLGNRIFGQAFNDKAENMTCACSRRKVEIRNQGSQVYSTLHCDSMGNYEPLQCDDGHCWCAESMTGEVISKVVPHYLMTTLPCYSFIEIGLNYTRPCESDDFAQQNLLHEFNIHGTDHINFPHVLCDDDGNYGAYRIEGSQVFCIWSDNSNIGYGADISEISTIDCLCARDTRIFEAAGSTQYLVCLPNGSYKKIQYQTISGKWYCVDKDGFRCTDFSETMPDNCNNCYET